MEDDEKEVLRVAKLLFDTETAWLFRGRDPATHIPYSIVSDDYRETYIRMARAVIEDRMKQDAAWVDRIGNL